MSNGLVLASRYRLVARLGGGGMGSVWRAHDMTLNAEVAVKLIDPKFADSPEAIARFRREAQAAAAIRSTHVVQVLDYGIEGETPFIAMELLRGESLAQRLEREQKLTPESTAHLLGHVARALSLAHGSGIVHRDLKPDNVFLVREGDEDIGKVLDFGIARLNGEREKNEALSTQTGALLGTPYYMSPEQANGQPVDALADVWSFGVIACECLTGRRAFAANTLAALFHAICVAPPPVPSEIAPVPEGFDEWFARATARDKALRYQSIQKAAEELRALVLRGTPLVFAPRPESEAVLAPAQGSLGYERTSTFLPTEHTAPALPEPTRSEGKGRGRTWLGALAAAALLATAGVGAWRLVSEKTAPATASAPSVPDAPPPVTSEAPEPSATVPTPAPVEPSTALVYPSEPATPSVAPEPSASAPAPRPQNRPAAGATKPVRPPASAGPKRTPAKREENAAGI